MKLQEPAAQHGDSGETIAIAQPRQVTLPGNLSNFFRKTLVIAEWEVRKLRHDPTDMLTRAVQPALWLLIFGEVFTRIRAIPTGSVPYLDFLAPGILSQSVLFIAIFYGITIIWERDLGVINKFLVSPTPRLALVLGKALSAGARALPQAIIIYILALVLGVRVNLNPLALLGVVVLVVLGAACFSTFSMIIDLSYCNYARLAASDRAWQSAHVSSGWVTCVDAGWQHRHVRPGNRFRCPVRSHAYTGRDLCQALSAYRRVMQDALPELSWRPLRQPGTPCGCQIGINLSDLTMSS